MSAPNITRIATRDDVRDAAVQSAQVVAPRLAALAERLESIDAKLDRLNASVDRIITIMQTVTRATT